MSVCDFTSDGSVHQNASCLLLFDRVLFMNGTEETSCVGADVPVDDPSVNRLQDNDPLGAVFKEVGHLLF